MQSKTHMAIEDYLETILLIQEKKGEVRSVDIADMLEVTRPSVTYATKKLKTLGYITMTKEGAISMTPEGLHLAHQVLDRHHLLTTFFVTLGVPEAIASEDACKVEHDLSQETFDAMAAFLAAKESM